MQRQEKCPGRSGRHHCAHIMSDRKITSRTPVRDSTVAQLPGVWCGHRVRAGVRSRRYCCIVAASVTALGLARARGMPTILELPTPRERHHDHQCRRSVAPSEGGRSRVPWSPVGHPKDKGPCGIRRKALICWSGRPDSNWRRPAWEVCWAPSAASQRSRKGALDYGGDP